MKHEDIVKRLSEVPLFRELSLAELASIIADVAQAKIL